MRWGNWGSGNFNDLLKLTQLMKGTAGIWSQAVEVENNNNDETNSDNGGGDGDDELRGPRPVPGSLILHNDLLRKILSSLPFYGWANWDWEEVICSMSQVLEIWRFTLTEETAILPNPGNTAHSVSLLKCQGSHRVWKTTFQQLRQSQSLYSIQK